MTIQFPQEATVNTESQEGCKGTVVQPEDGSFWKRWSQSWVEAKSRIPLEWRGGGPKRWVGVVETGYTDKA